MKKFYTMLICLFLLYGCVNIQHKGSPGTCGFDELQGIEFICKQRTSSRTGYPSYNIDQNYFYKSCGLNANDIFHTISMPYKTYNTLRGKIINGKPVYKTDFCEIYEVAFENCLKTFVRVLNTSSDLSVTEKFLLSFPGDICFLSDIEKANNLVSKNIWVNTPKKNPYTLFLKDAPSNIDTYHLDKVKVINVYTDPVRPGRDYCQFYLVVLTPGNQLALYPYIEKLFFMGDPINPDWPDEIKQNIKNGIICLNMTPEQIMLIIGEPDKINRSLYSSGIHEQWVYGNSYVYFENGRCSALQGF